MRNQIIIVTFSICATVITTAAILANAGPLNPPAGPVAPTTEIEARIPLTQETTPGNTVNVFIISQPGSYYLTGDVTGGANQNGVRIDASHVTLDLNGFTVRGPDSTFRDGVYTFDDSLRGLEVRNGVVRGWRNGVDFLLSKGGRVVDVRAEGNSMLGVRATNGAYIAGCTAVENGVGIVGSFGATIEGCAANSNTVDGFNVGFGATITGCVARDNTGHGITVSDGAAVQGNNCSGNGGAGINLSNESGARVEGNNIVDNGVGIQVGPGGVGNLIIRNSAGGNGTDYNIAAGNAHGSVVNVAGAGDISSVATASHPWANFVY